MNSRTEKIHRLSQLILTESYGMEEIDKGAMMLTLAEFCLNIAMDQCELSPDAVLDFARIITYDRKQPCQ